MTTKIQDFQKNLSELILKEIETMDCTYIYFADICDIHRNELSAIINLKRKNISVETVLKICNNTKISIVDIFEIDDLEIFNSMIKNFYLTNGVDIFKIK